MAYDKADWHYGGDFPEGLPDENGGTHIGMFLAWAIMNGLEGELHHEESPEALAAVRSRQMTGREFLFQECDEKFWDVDLNAEANEFAKHYYDGSSPYFEDYETTLAEGLPTMYHVEDTWENYDKIAAVIDQRFNAWQSSR